MNNWICPKCMMFLCKPEVTQAEALKALNRHLQERHEGNQSKVKNTTGSASVKGKPREISKAEAQRKAGRQAQMEARKRAFLSVRPNPRMDVERSESTFIPDVERDAPIQGNIAFHQSPRKIGNDGVPIYEKTLFGKGVLETLLLHPEMMRRARTSPSLPSIGATEEIQIPKASTRKPAKVHLPIVEPSPLKDAAAPVEKSVDEQATPAHRSPAVLKLSQVLMTRLREIDMIAKNRAVLPCCSEAELKDGLRICQSVAARLTAAYEVEFLKQTAAIMQEDAVRPMKERR